MEEGYLMSITCLQEPENLYFPFETNLPRVIERIAPQRQIPAKIRKAILMLSTKGT